MKALFKHLKTFHPFGNTLLTVLFTMPQVLILGSMAGEKVLAQTSCPAGTTQATLNWGQSNFQRANFNQTLNIGSVSTNFQLTENPPGIVRDESPQNSPGNLGAVPFGIAPGPFGGVNRPYLRWGIDARNSTQGGNATLTITFAQPVTLPLALTLFDVDRDRPGEAPYQDQITVTASNQGQNVPVTLSNIGAGAVTEIVNNNTARGAEPRRPPGNANPGDNFGNVFARFSGAVTQIRIVYESGPLYSNPGQDETIGLADITICTSPVSGTGEPNLRLVKRITNATRNGQPISNVNFNTFVDNPDEEDDNILQQSGRPPLGQINLQAPFRSGDEIEYTIYFLSQGNQQLQNVRFCDLIPPGTSYVPNSLSVDGIANQGRVLSPLAPLEDFTNICDGNNNNGAVIIGPTNIPNNQSGLIRFRVRID